MRTLKGANFFDYSMSDIDQMLQHLLLFSKMCAPEYNALHLSDRVLVFDIMKDDWEKNSILGNISATTEVIEPSNDLPTDAFLAATKGKRRLETEEEANLKRMKTTSSEQQIQTINSLETEAQHKSGGHGGEFQDLAGEHAAEYETKSTAELVSDQEENKLVENPSSSDAVTSEAVSESPLFVDQDILSIKSKILKHEPLRQHAIHIHSLWLAVQSPYFQSLLHSSGMKETHDKKVHLKIPESEEDAHLTLLQAMYNGEVLNDKTVDELLAVLKLAEKYDIKFVFKICKYVLQKNATTFEICTQIMHVIKVKHNMSDVEDLATTLQLVFAKEFSPLDEKWQSEKFTNLSEPSLTYLLSSDDLIVQSENTVFHALMYWMEQNEIDPASLEETNDLLAVVRFKLVTIDYLLNVINNHPIASKMPKFGELYLIGMTYHATPPEQKELLKVQPVFRKKPERNIVQFTFVVGEEEYKTSYKTKNELHSDEFWACGYKMSVVLIWNYSYYAHHLCPHLNIHNLNEESLVPLRFAVSENTTSNISWQQETFNLNVCRKSYPSADVSVSWSNYGKRELYVIVKPS